jgi:DNA-binding PucR family transcriptional regulator
MTLQDVLQLPLLQPCAVPTGRDLEQNRDVTGVSVQEIPIDRFIRRGELVLSTGMGVGKDARRLVRFIRDVAQAGASALALAIGPHTPRIPPSAVAAANHAGLPLIRLPWEIRFSEISESILRRLIQEQMQTRTRDDFVWTLATENAGEESLAAHARQIGVDLRAPRLAVVGKLCGGIARTAEEVCHKIAAQHNLEWLGAAVGDSVVGYLSEPAAAAKIDSILRTVQRALRDRSTISWGVGRICREPPDFRKSYEDARVACEIGQRARGAESVTHVSDVLADRVLLNLRHDADVHMLLARYIHPLETARRTPLLLTLEVFFACDGNASAAARKLAITRQSLLYRLAKIEALLKIELHSTEQRFALALALRLHRFSDSVP